MACATAQSPPFESPAGCAPMASSIAMTATTRKLSSSNSPVSSPAGIAVLTAIKQGVRIKQIAHGFNVSEGAIKQRQRNAP